MFDKLVCAECKLPMTRVESWSCKDRKDRTVSFMCDCGHKVEYATRAAPQPQPERRSA